jgi:hypothetical protein
MHTHIKQTILLLETGWEARHGPCESACAALKLWDAYARTRSERLVSVTEEDAINAQVFAPYIQSIYTRMCLQVCMSLRL